MHRDAEVKRRGRDRKNIARAPWTHLKSSSQEFEFSVFEIQDHSRDECMPSLALLIAPSDTSAHSLTSHFTVSVFPT